MQEVLSKIRPQALRTARRIPQTSVPFKMVATRFDDFCETKRLPPEEKFPLVSLNRGHNVRFVEVTIT